MKNFRIRRKATGRLVGRYGWKTRSGPQPEKSYLDANLTSLPQSCLPLTVVDDKMSLKYHSVLHCDPVMSELAPNMIRLCPNGTNVF